MSRYLDAAEAAYSAMTELARHGVRREKPIDLAEGTNLLTDLIKVTNELACAMRNTAHNTRFGRQTRPDPEVDELLAGLDSQFTACINRGRALAKAWGQVRGQFYEIEATAPTTFRI
ncbi:hypothetical protein [Crossiella sp. CA198]|uniref:hypothetical protein n=1 Tax=Crossiella sp. CA198 TaxID=3455607 RepID=UPI003F8D721A